MSLFLSSLSDPITWTSDRGCQTPADFGNPQKEYQIVTEKSAWVDSSHYGVVEISGPDRIAFFGGLITNQIKNVSPSRSVYSAMLTPQGRFLWDFTLVHTQDTLLLVTEPDRVQALVQRISMYILRAKVKVVDVSHAFSLFFIAGPEAKHSVATLFPDLNSQETFLTADLGVTFFLEAGSNEGLDGIHLWQDPRHIDFGWRLLVPTQKGEAFRTLLMSKLPIAGLSAWDSYRIIRGLPRGGSELLVEQSLPLESGLLELNGVDFGKGCYIGQETTARTHHRGTLKKRVFQVTFHSKEAAPPGTPVLVSGKVEAGIITSSSQNVLAGLALLRLSDVENQQPLSVLGEVIQIFKPSWAKW